MAPGLEGRDAHKRVTADGKVCRGLDLDSPVKTEASWSLEDVSTMGQRRGKTHCLTSVLLVQESLVKKKSLVSLLNHRIQKMTGVTISPLSQG